MQNDERIVGGVTVMWYGGDVGQFNGVMRAKCTEVPNRDAQVRVQSAFEWTRTAKTALQSPRHVFWLKMIVEEAKNGFGVRPDISLQFHDYQKLFYRICPPSSIG